MVIFAKFVTYRFVPFAGRLGVVGAGVGTSGGTDRGELPQRRPDQGGDLLRGLPEMFGRHSEDHFRGRKHPGRTGSADAHKHPPGPIPDVEPAGGKVGGADGHCLPGGQREGDLDLPVEAGQQFRGTAALIVERLADQGAPGDRPAARQRPPHRLDGDETLAQGIDDHGAGRAAVAGPLGQVDDGTGRHGAGWQPGAVHVRRGEPGRAAEGHAGHRRVTALGWNQHRDDLVIVVDQTVQLGGGGPTEHRSLAAREQASPGSLDQGRPDRRDQHSRRGLPPHAGGDPRPDVGPGETGADRVALADDT
ncbi:hypothetical protein CcI49_26260 [Frankia sp. CcI49]|nr:hypothetical protein CcI49_26260 [Frankia sp. CcI49]